MGDMARILSEAPPNKKLRDGEDTLVDDWFSLLPEEIVVGILSRLKLKEAASTSILSQKWRSLWTFTTGSLDFDDEKTMAEFRAHSNAKSITVERTKFISWVNQVLNQHKGLYIEELRICFNLEESSTHEVDRWIIFAIDKSVQRLELDLSNCSNSHHAQPYKFPSVEKMTDLISSNTSAKHLKLNCHNLRSLRLKHVSITDEVLGSVLSHCSLLECLCVANALHLKNVMIIGSAPNLKYLEIRDCSDLLHMEVSAVNLVSVKYIGGKIPIFLNEVPHLSEIYTGGDYTEYLIFQCPHRLTNLFQLETLRFCFPDQITRRYLYQPFFQLNNIKHLEVIITSSQESSLLRYTCLLVGFPFLTTLKMQLNTRDPWEVFQPTFELEFLEQVSCGYPTIPQGFLKVVELVNFTSYPADINLARRLLQITPSLEKMIVQLKEGMVNIGAAMYRAGTLRRLLPPGAELVILPLDGEDEIATFVKDDWSDDEASS